MSNSTEKLREMLDIPLSRSMREAIIEVLSEDTVRQWTKVGSRYPKQFTEIFSNEGNFQLMSDGELINEIKKVMRDRGFNGSVNEFLEEYGEGNNF